MSIGISIIHLKSLGKACAYSMSSCILLLVNLLGSVSEDTWLSLIRSSAFCTKLLDYLPLSPCFSLHFSLASPWEARNNA